MCDTYQRTLCVLIIFCLLDTFCSCSFNILAVLKYQLVGDLDEILNSLKYYRLLDSILFWYVECFKARRYNI